MGFMQIQTTFGLWYKVEVNGETHYIPPNTVYLEGIEKGETFDVDSLSDYLNQQKKEGKEVPDALELWDEWITYIQDYVEPKLRTTNKTVDVNIEAWEGWGAQYHAPGYLDQTDWVLGDTEEEAISECKEIYGSDEDEVEDVENEEVEKE